MTLLVISQGQVCKTLCFCGSLIPKRSCTAVKLQYVIATWNLNGPVPFYATLVFEIQICHNSVYQRKTLPFEI